MKNNSFVKYKDLLTIKNYNQITDKEEFCLLPLDDEFVFGKYLETKNMLEYGEKIPVRKTVYEKLIKVSKKLKEIDKDYKLIVVYGFRDLKTQEKYFNEILESVKDKFDDELEMYEYIHTKIAIPNVAGHPTGGAVDLAIYDSQNNIMLDFGTEILDYSTEKCYYYNDNISEVVRKNRELLRNIMITEEFAPYDGEWWHFSYGDKEWAFYYKKEMALYNQVNSDRVFQKR